MCAAGKHKHKLKHNWPAPLDHENTPEKPKIPHPKVIGSWLWRSYSEDEADDGRPRRGHDFGTVGHKVEQRGHDALCCMIKLVAQQRRQVSGEGKQEVDNQFKIAALAVSWFQPSLKCHSLSSLCLSSGISHLQSEPLVKVLVNDAHLSRGMHPTH